MAEDDADDRLLASEALAERRESNKLEFVEDGCELLEYLRSEGNYAAKPRSLPGLILLDLNMPRMNGLEALAKIKEDSRLCLIPVVVLTTSNRETDIVSSYSLGAASFLTKPAAYTDLVSMMSVLSDYWADLVQLPNSGEKC
tara:strand:- start:269903 stop:270328 length:426 start_codon:yes stop_codon:yes gene_type:complete